MLLGIVSIGLSMLYKKLMGDGALQRDFLFQGGSNDIGAALSRIDISRIKSVSFMSPGEKPILSGESENLKRIAAYIIKQTNKKVFGPGELEPYYDLIAPVVKSQYGQAALTKGKALMKNFVEKG